MAFQIVHSASTPTWWRRTGLILTSGARRGSQNNLAELIKISMSSHTTFQTKKSPLSPEIMTGSCLLYTTESQKLVNTLTWWSYSLKIVMLNVVVTICRLHHSQEGHDVTVEAEQIRSQDLAQLGIIQFWQVKLFGIIYRYSMTKYQTYPLLYLQTGGGSSLQSRRISQGALRLHGVRSPLLLHQFGVLPWERGIEIYRSITVTHQSTVIYCNDYCNLPRRNVFRTRHGSISSGIPSIGSSPPSPTRESQKGGGGRRIALFQYLQTYSYS